VTSTRILDLPTLSDVIPIAVADAFVDFDPDVGSVTAAGITTSLGSGRFTRSSGSPLRTALVGLSGRTAIFSSGPSVYTQATGSIAVLAADPWEVGVAWLPSSLTTAQGVLGIDSLGADGIRQIVTTRAIGAVYNGATLALATPIPTTYAAYASLAWDGAGTLTLSGATWDPAAPAAALVLETATAAAVGHATATIALRVGTLGASALDADHHILGAYAIKRALTVEERQTILRFYMHERAVTP
jgi:hypothetical protein